MENIKPMIPATNNTFADIALSIIVVASNLVMWASNAILLLQGMVALLSLVLVLWKLNSHRLDRKKKTNRPIKK